MRTAVDFQVQGKRALVSGSTAGIGFAIARASPAEGASVIVNGRTEARTEAAVAAIRESGLPGRRTAVTVFVASPRSSGINGAVLRVDGGVVRAVG